MTSKELERELRRLHGQYRTDVANGDLLGALTIREQIGRLAIAEVHHLLDALYAMNNPLSVDAEEEAPF